MTLRDKYNGGDVAHRKGMNLLRWGGGPLIGLLGARDNDLC